MSIRVLKQRFLPFFGLCLLAQLLFTAGARAEEVEGTRIRDPHYGEVLFYFYQQRHFEALSHLVTSEYFGRIDDHAAEAELLRGGLLLSWGQHREAGRIFEALLSEVEDDQSVRDRTWFYIGKVRYQRGYYDEAAAALESIVGALPPELEAERYNVQASTYMALGRYSEAAAILAGWDSDDIWMQYARFNLGVALVRMGLLVDGAALLNQVGTMEAADDEALALRDRANVALGFAYLQADLDGDAKPVLQRVRLSGPFSNKALLGAGWADAANEEYRKALAPWMMLSKRTLMDSAVQESLLAVPYAFAKLDAEPQAAQFYARALDIYDLEIARIDRAIASSVSNEFIRELIAQDPSLSASWYWQLDTLPGDERTRTLYFAIADHRFHEGLRSYRDLMLMNAHLDDWRVKLDTYRDMVATRQIAYAQRLPDINARMAQFDLAGMQSRYDALRSELDRARDSHDVVALATGEQRAQWQRLEALESSPAWGREDASAQQAKQRVLKGLLLWDMERDFRYRAWQQQRELDELGQALDRAAAGMQSVEYAVASVPGDVNSFEGRIGRLEARVREQQSLINWSLEEHAKYLRGIVVGELKAQRQRLVTYRAQAGFALASIYDRMAASGN